jgi:hypothetical protein
MSIYQIVGPKDGIGDLLGVGLVVLRMAGMVGVCLVGIGK